MGFHLIVSASNIVMESMPMLLLVKLGYSQRETLWWNTEYSAENASEAELNRLWDATIPWESGIIALSNEDATRMTSQTHSLSLGTPRGRRFI